MSNDSGNATADSLSETTLELDPDNLSEECSKWANSISSAGLSSIDVTGTYAPLTSCGVATAYIPSLKKALEMIESTSLSISKSIKTTAEDQTGVDGKYSNQSGNGNRSGSGGGGGGGGGGHSTTPVTSPPETQTTEPEAELELGEQFVEEFNKIDADSYIEFMTTLESLLGEDVVTYLTDESKASKLKDLLLKTCKNNNELTKIISEMEDKEVQTTLVKLLVTDSKLNEFARLALSDYVDVIKPTIEDQNKKNSEVLFDDIDTLINDTTTLIKETDLQSTISKVFKGEIQVNDKTSELIKVTMSKIAEVRGVDLDTLLSDKKYAEDIGNGMDRVTEALSYFKLIKNTGAENSDNIYEALMKGSA